MVAAPSPEISGSRKQTAPAPVFRSVESQKLLALLAPWNGRRLNIAGISRTLGVSRPTARACVRRLEKEGRIRLLPSFGSGHRPLLRLVGRYDDRLESFRSFCTDAVISRLREVDSGCRFYYWKTGRTRQIDLLAVIARKRIGFCFSTARICQNRHWWPLRLAWRRGVIHLGYLLNTGCWPCRIGREMYERPIGAFLSTLESAPLTRKRKDQQENETNHGNSPVDEREPLWRLLRDNVNAEKRKAAECGNDEQDQRHDRRGLQPRP
jgi:hypothetical protein